MTEAEKRLAEAVSVWARSEIERHFDVHPEQSLGAYCIVGAKDPVRFCHVAYCCSGLKNQAESMGNDQATIEMAARSLVHEVLTAAYLGGHLRGSVPSRIVWRNFPEIDENNDLNLGVLSTYNTYCRLSFVPANLG